VKTGTFSVSLGDLEDGPKEMTGPLTREWVRNLLQDTEVEPAGDADGRLDVTLTKNGVEVLVQGYLDVTVSVPCARTLDPAVYRLKPEVFLMLSPAGGGESTLRSGRGQRDREQRRGKKPEKTHDKKSGWDKDPELSEEDAASDTYSGDQIVLDEFLREFILLEIPMLPLREDLRGVPFEANPPLPAAGASVQDATVAESGEAPLDPRLSPLRDLKARLEKKE
jgi:uncharacterized metal-binding protein YceD (DUF177 family)